MKCTDAQVGASTLYGMSSRYQHFCATAMALDVVGDRWALLVVRDLLGGPKRFTTLMDLLGGITPRTLTQRLRDLEAAQLVAADRTPGRREVWYRLTDRGEELRPVVDELTKWGLRHLARMPMPEEAVHPVHVLNALRMVLESEQVDVGRVRWSVRSSDFGDAYLLTGESGRWELEHGVVDDFDVEISGSRRELVEFIVGPDGSREKGRLLGGVSLAGEETAVASLEKVLSAFPPSRETRG